MERIIRVSIVLTIMTISSLIAILIASNETFWTTSSPALVVGLVLVAVMIVWIIVHNQFPREVEMMITAGIVLALIVLLLFAGAEIKQVLKDVLDDASGWWLVSPAIGSAAIVWLFKLHEKEPVN